MRKLAGLPQRNINARPVPRASLLLDGVMPFLLLRVLLEKLTAKQRNPHSSPAAFSRLALRRPVNGLPAVFGSNRGRS